MTSLIILATVMAILGVVGYLRGTKSALITTLFIVGGLALIQQREEQIVKAINDQAKLIPPNTPGPAMALLMLFLLGVGLLVGRSRMLHGQPSLGGMLLGLLNGYLVTMFVLTALGLGELVPLPFVSELRERYAAPTEVVLLGEEGDVLKHLTALATQPGNKQLVAIFVAILIALFIIAATRFGSKGTKRG